MINHYWTGAAVRCEILVKDIVEALHDPAGMKFKYTTAAGVTTTYIYGTDVQLVRDGAGAYHVDVATAGADGDWSYRWESTDGLAEESSFHVKGTQIV